MNQTMKLLDVVALLEDCSEQGVVRGQVGTIVRFARKPRKMKSQEGTVKSEGATV
jgi:hypothetical protein